MTTPAPARFVLDSFALLAYLQDEPGADVMEEMLGAAADSEMLLAMASVNLGEVAYQTIRRQGDTQARRTIAELARYPIAVIDVDRQLALEGAALKAIHPISYADCIAAALAQRLDAAVVTGDPDFHRLEHLVRVEWLPGV